MKARTGDRLPAVVYVYQEENRDRTTDLLAAASLEDRGEGIVGIYELKEVVETRYEPQVKRAGSRVFVPIKQVV